MMKSIRMRASRTWFKPCTLSAALFCCTQASCAVEEPSYGIARTSAAQTAQCRRLEIVAGTPSGKREAQRAFYDPVSLALPATFQTLEGNNGNNRITLRASRAGGEPAACVWRRADSTRTTAGFRKTYSLESCTNGLSAGDKIVGDLFDLQVDNGERGFPVKLTLEEVAPCKTEDWLEGLPHFSRHVSGFDETVVLVADVDKYVLRADGRLQDPAAFEAEEEAAEYARLGSISSTLLKKIEPDQGTPPASVHVAFWFAIPVNWTLLTTRLNSPVAVVRSKARADLDEAIAKAGAALLPTLVAAGAVEIQAAPGLPALFGVATPAQIRSLRTHPEIRLMELAELVPPVVTGVPRNVTTDSHIDTVFNSATPVPFYAEGLGLGVREARPNCGFFEAHESFQFATKANYVPVRSCEDDGLCQPCSLLGVVTPDSQDYQCLDNGPGKGKQCVQRHLTATLSAAVATHGGTPFAAARARIFNFNYTASPCSDLVASQAYDWFVKNEVSTAYESFECYSPAVAQDFWARTKNMAIMKAADNDVGLHACEDLHHNAICVGASTLAGTVWAEAPPSTLGSSFVNPVGSDREEPDVLVLGRQTELAETNVLVPGGVDRTKVTSGGDDPKDRKHAGTSIAAPIVGALVLLTKEFCGAPDMDQRFTRSIIMTSAWSRNADGWLYSTPGVKSNGVLFDHKDGAGVPMAENLMLFCGKGGSGQPSTAGGTVLVDLLDTPKFPGFRLYRFGRPPGGTGLGDPGPGPTPSTGKASSSLRGARYWSAVLNAGDRVRTVFSWDSCITGKVNRVKVDFDVWLCNESATPAYCMYASRSLDDNNEGMDVLVDQPGKWALWYTFPGPTGEGIYEIRPPSCNDADVEPAAFNTAWGRF